MARECHVIFLNKSPSISGQNWALVNHLRKVWNSGISLKAKSGWETSDDEQETPLTYTHKCTHTQFRPALAERIYLWAMFCAISVRTAFPLFLKLRFLISKCWTYRETIVSDTSRFRKYRKQQFWPPSYFTRCCLWSALQPVHLVAVWTDSSLCCCSCAACPQYQGLREARNVGFLWLCFNVIWTPTSNSV